MASFDRVQYQAIYGFARRVALHHGSRNNDLEREAIEIMWMCEDVLGQQSDFEEWMRMLYPRLSSLQTSESATDA